MFHRAWVQLSLLLILIGLIARLTTTALVPEGSAAAGFQPPTWSTAFLALGSFLAAVILVSWGWDRRVLRHVRYERRVSHPRNFPGQTFDLTLVVENRKLLPVGWLRVEDSWPVALTPLQPGIIGPSALPDQGLLAHSFSLRGYERTHRQYTFRCEQRGIYMLGPVRLESGDPFGLFSHTEERALRTHIVVYPRLLPLPALGLPPKDPLGDLRTRRRLFEDPNRIMGARDMRPGDSFRQIHWKATARQGKLQVKVYEPTTSQNVVLCLNVATFAQYWEGTEPEKLEQVISVAASLAQWAIEHKYAVGLIANGALAHSDQPFRILPGRSPTQLMRLLEALAGVSPFVTSTLESLLLRESPRLPWGATFVVISAVVTPELLATLRRLHEAGRRLVLVSLADEPVNDVPGVFVYNLGTYRVPMSS
ncbi:MAG: DUF58 domain-containing protein [Chloroflexota bacterium]